MSSGDDGYCIADGLNYHQYIRPAQRALLGATENGYELVTDHQAGIGVATEDAPGCDGPMTTRFTRVKPE